MADVVLLNFAGPPPGYTWDERRTGHLRDIYDDLVGPLTDAWTHYKARFDPPGMATRWAGGTYAEPARRWVWVLFFEHHGEQYNLIRDFKSASQEEARAAAWRWYEARVELYNILRKLNPPREFWPLILTWSDQDWLDVHTFLVEHFDVILAGGADGLTFPAVLRG